MIIQRYSHYADGRPLVYQTYEPLPPAITGHRTPDGDGFSWTRRLAGWRREQNDPELRPPFLDGDAGYHTDTERALDALAQEEQAWQRVTS